MSTQLTGRCDMLAVVRQDRTADQSHGCSTDAVCTTNSTAGGAAQTYNTHTAATAGPAHLEGSCPLPRPRPACCSLLPQP